MANNDLSITVSKFAAVKCYRLGDTRITRSNKTSEDHNTIVVGLTLWFGILLDLNDWAFYDCRQVRDSVKGRIISYTLPSLKHEVDLGQLLTYLDEYNDILLDTLSSTLQFKAEDLLVRIASKKLNPEWNPLKGIILSILQGGVNRCKQNRDFVYEYVKSARQMFSFLKKLDVDRADLREEMYRDFLDFEKVLTRTTREQRSNPDYIALVSHMRDILLQHMDYFTMTPFVPKHGPGAVAQVSAKCWYDKYQQSCTDERVRELLGRCELGMEESYLPLVNKDISSTQTSRFVTVPKTWKKLRGISTEPSELQFWQQGVLHAIDRMFTNDSWWAARINLHDQSRSQEYAKMSSLTGEYATVDLSAASDSVTTQLVEDVFKGTLLGDWLLGTRSIFTVCNEQKIFIRKFAPMGSATCFPTEGIVFILVSEVAIAQTYNPILDEKGRVIVFGDDIVIPYYAVDRLFELFDLLGFSVNKEKSYWKGHFREACGIEAWNGQDIRPVRFKSCRSGPSKTNTDHAELSQLRSLANQFFDRGYHTARKWLLSMLFSKTVTIGKHDRTAQKALYSTFSGERSTLSSPQPTNFPLVRKYSRDLQTHKVKRIQWKEKLLTSLEASIHMQTLEKLNYLEWLIRHQPGLTPDEEEWYCRYDERTKKLVVRQLPEERQSTDSSKLPIGVVMVPTVKWGLPPSYDCISVAGHTF